MSDGKVTISTALDNGSLQKDMKNLPKAIGSAGKGLLKAIGGITAGITAAFGAAAVAVTKQSTDAYADYEQLTGGVETLFKNAASKVKAYAEDAFYTAGVDANEYMETVTGISASLISSLGGDTEKAAEIADMAMTDMADNANKMGTPIENVKTAYAGFAKQQYMLLDNLKLGYGGTKTEMQRLLKDAQAFSGVKYDINNLADVYSAIHVIQEKLSIAGATAEEAEKTITGSANMTKAAWKNVLSAIAGGGDLDKAINNLVYSISRYFENIVPVVERSLSGIGQLIERIAPMLVQTVATALIKAIPSLLNAVYQMVIGLAKGIYQGIAALFSGGGTKQIAKQLNNVAGGYASAAEGAEDLESATEAAGKAAKKSLAGFDELNILQNNTDSESGGGASAGGFNVSVGNDTSGTLNEGFDTTQVEKFAEIIKTIAGYVPVIAAGLAGLKLGKFITDLLTANFEAKTLKETIALLGKKAGLTVGITLAVTGLALEIKGISDVIQEGLNGINFAEIIGGGGALAGGGALIGKFFGSALIGGTVGAIVGGVGAVFAGIYDACVNGIDWLSAALTAIGTTAMGAGIGALIGSVGGPLGALIGLAVGLVTDLVILIVQNWEAISAWFSEVFAVIGQWFADLWQGIVDIWGVCAEWFNTTVIQPIAGFFSGLWEGISTAASTCWNAIVEFFSPAIEWFSELFNSVWQTISDIFYNIGVIASGCWEIIKAVWAIVSEWFDTNIIQPVAGFFTDLWTSISNWAIGAWENIKAVFSTIGNWINTNIVQPVSNFFSGLWNGFLEKARAAWEGVKTVFGKVASFFSDTFKKAWEGIVKVFSIAGEIFNDIKDGILTAFKSIVNGIIKGLNSAIAVPFNGINWALEKIRDINIVGLTPFSGLKTINVPQIPYLAQGAVLPPNKPFMAVVGDQKHGTNIEAPLATIQEAVALVMQDFVAGNMAGHEATVAVLREILEAVLGISIGDDVIAGAVSRYNTRMAVVKGGLA